MVALFTKFAVWQFTVAFCQFYCLAFCQFSRCSFWQFSCFPNTTTNLTLSKRGVERTFLQAVAAIYSSLRRDDDGGIIHEICCHAVPYQQKENCLVAWLQVVDNTCVLEYNSNWNFRSYLNSELGLQGSRPWNQSKIEGIESTR